MIRKFALTVFASSLTVFVMSCGRDKGSQMLSGQSDKREDRMFHRPICKFQGSRSEGWYWLDTTKRIKWDICAGRPTAECVAVGTRSEGWYSGGQLITWDSSCHEVRWIR